VRRAVQALSFLVRDYDEAIGFFTGALGFSLLEDTPLGGAKRWVRVAPPGGAGCALLLARATGPEQIAAVGRQAGGRVFLFLETADFDADHAALRRRGVRFLEEPRVEPYGKVAVFADLYGNKWDLLQPRPAKAGA
jgi:catechol 2,3-dioxygenase-like lactoylglutathione lyase family enzyme